MNNKLRNIFFLIGLIAIVVMCFTFDVSFVELWKDITKASHWLLVILVLWGGLYALNSWTWIVIIKGSGDCPVSFWRIFKLTVSGFALNYATPVGLLGGEPYKIMELSTDIGKHRATSSVLLFAMMHIFTHFWYWVTAIVVYIIMSCFGLLTMNVGMGIILALMSIFCYFGIYLFVKGYKNGLTVKLIHLAGKIPGCKKRVAKWELEHKDDLLKIDKQISELQGQNKRSFYGSFLLEYVGRMLQSLEIFFILLVFDPSRAHPITLVYSFLILAFTSLFANLLFFFPLQLGGREGGFAMSTAQMGMTNDIGLFISIICRVRELFWASIGLLLIKIGNKK